MKTGKNINKLPIWAQNLVAEQQHQIDELAKQNQTLEEMIPWVPGKNGAKMEWTTLYHPSVTLPHEPITLFQLHQNRAQPVLTLGAQDCLFVGRTINKSQDEKFHNKLKNTI